MLYLLKNVSKIIAGKFINILLNVIKKTYPIATNNHTNDCTKK